MTTGFKIFAACKVLAHYTIPMDIVSQLNLADIRCTWTNGAICSALVEKWRSFVHIFSLQMKKNFIKRINVETEMVRNNFTPKQSISITFNDKTMTLVNRIWK